MKFCQPSGFYTRFKTHGVNVGGVVIGGNKPVRIQSMVNTPTDNIKATVFQIKKLAEAGCELARITVRNSRDIEYFRQIKNDLRGNGYSIPLIADVHFSAKVALGIAEIADKVRINPGNYTDVSKSSDKKTFTEKEYDLEKEKAFERILPLIKVCKKNGTALRVGVNHGSLSWRIVERYGNTTAGMTESAMEFLRIFYSENFENAVVSMKSSDPFTMIHSTRMLVQKMYENGMTFPLHLGVTEAGIGSDGIFRSGIGIGALLCDGIGDTIRVSLSGDPLNEIPACMEILRNCRNIVNKSSKGKRSWYNNPFSSEVQTYSETGFKLPAVISLNDKLLSDNKIKVTEITGKTVHDLRNEIQLKYSKGNCPVFLKSKSVAGVKHAVIAGFLMADNLFAGWVTSEKNREGYLKILYSSGMVRGAMVYVSCPTCGRTSYDLEKVAMEVKEKTKKFKGLKIAVMGCIVNGPGEMEGADYGILGEAKGRVSIYKGTVCILKGIKEKDVVEKMLQIISEDIKSQN